MADLEKRIYEIIVHGNVLLDIGCGIRPMRFYEPKTHICIDAFKQYTDILSHAWNSEPNKVIINSDALDFVRQLPDQSVDCVLCLDAIEHIEKEKAKTLIDEFNRVARRQIIIGTPLGFFEQHHEDDELDKWGVTHNPLQEHLSGWAPDDFGKKWSFYHFTAENNDTNPAYFYAVKSRQEHPSLPAKTLFVGDTIPPVCNLQSTQEESEHIKQTLSPYAPTSYGITSIEDKALQTAYFRIGRKTSYGDFAVNRLPAKYHNLSLTEEQKIALSSCNTNPPQHLLANNKTVKNLVDSLSNKLVPFDYKVIICCSNLHSNQMLAICIAAAFNCPLIYWQTSLARPPSHQSIRSFFKKEIPYNKHPHFTALENAIKHVSALA